MIANYIPRNEYIGDGTQNYYTFDFLITDLSQLLVIVTDSLFNLQFSVRGTDIVNLSNVKFNNYGGGSVTLIANLALNYNLTLLLANDAPTQQVTFRDQGNFTLRQFESALDYTLSAIQRLTYLASRSLRLGDNLSQTLPFNTLLPVNSTNPGIQNNVGMTPVVNATNNGFILAPTGSTVPVQSPSIAPANPVAGSQAYTSLYVLAVYNGTSWVKAADGSTPVTF